MKKLLIILALGNFVSISSFAQEKYTTYYSSYFDKDYEIDVSFKDNKLGLYIDLAGLDRLRETGGISINDKSYDGFMENLQFARSKYEEWIKVAIENDVRDLTKDVELKTEVITGYFVSGGEYTFDFSVRPSFDFKILDDEKGLRHLLIFRTGELESSSNRYITASDFVMVFSSLEEMDEFIELISKEKLNEFKNKTSDKSSLFKN
ncbi:hypothetical protein [uncultured Algoriphagus sp.]|uniref:hypothetical protein n=1 Tax=uncultured Algoriphagus sp. TaxID=417365 RepID=UPI00258EE97F|nr:hypothetical protein [uncultured Algoriphagus sp.]